MRLNSSQLAAHLAKALAPLYVVGGAEPLLAQEALDAIRAAARKAGYSEREVLDADKTFNWQLLVDTCASMSLFAQRRMVELRLPSGAPGVEGSKILQELATRPPQDVLLILSCGEVDKKSRQGGWYQALENAGAALYFESVKPAEFGAWLAGRAKGAGLQIEADALKLLAERTEGNLLAAAQDLEKLKLLFPGQAVSAELLSQAVADSARYEAFDLSDRVLDGDGAGAVRTLQRLREEGSAVLEILGALGWSLRQAAVAAQVYARTRDAHGACAEARVFGSANVARMQRALPRLRQAETLGWLRRAAVIDRRVKSGEDAAAWEDLLTLILSASGTPVR